MNIKIETTTSVLEFVEVLDVEITDGFYIVFKTNRVIKVNIANIVAIEEIR